MGDGDVWVCGLSDGEVEDSAGAICDWIRAGADWREEFVRGLDEFGGRLLADCDTADFVDLCIDGGGNGGLGSYWQGEESGVAVDILATPCDFC